MGRNLLFVVTLFFSLLSHGQTLLVSDIDDTLKLANVNDLTEAARYAFDDESRFTGMNLLYQSLVRDQADLKIAYLTKAPRWLMARTHTEFLRKGQFPAGQYIPRTEYSSEEHKLQWLRILLNENRPRKVILIGDNGEQDAQVYNQIVQEYAHQGIEFYQYIRIVYSSQSTFASGSSLYAEQTGFVTPLELSLEFEKNHFLQATSLNFIIQNIGQNILMQKSHASSGDVAFPYYVDCRDFRWHWNQDLGRFDILKNIKERLVERCKLQ